MLRRFIFGLITGTAVSGIVWPVLLNAHGGSQQMAMIVLCGVPLAKITAACVIIAFPKMRGFGIGLLVSLPLGFLIFFGVCAASIDLGH